MAELAVVGHPVDHEAEVALAADATVGGEPRVTLEVEGEGLRHPGDHGSGVVQAGPELHVLVAPGPVERLAPSTDVERLSTVVADVAAMEEVVRMRVAVDAAGPGLTPVAGVTRTVRGRVAEGRQGVERAVHVGVHPDPARQPDEPPQAEGGRGAVLVTGRVGGHEPRWHHHVVVDRDDQVALGGGEAAVAGPRGREAGPLEAQPFEAQRPPHARELPAGTPGRRALDHDHLQAAAVALGHEAPQGGGEMFPRAAVGHDHGHVAGAPAAIPAPPDTVAHR